MPCPAASDLRCSKRASTVAAGSTVRPTPAKATLPPQTPLNRSASVAASAAALPAVPESAHCDDDYAENDAPDRTSYTSSNITSVASRESEGTIKTSLTQIKERPLSTDSHTVIRATQA